MMQVFFGGTGRSSMEVEQSLRSVCVCDTLLLRDFFMCNTCRGTQHVTGIVSTEITSGMGRED